MEVIDVEPQSTHGGSMRYTLAHKGQKSNGIRKPWMRIFFSGGLIAARYL